MGYTGRGAPKDHPEYLIARREHRLFLNLVDADDPKYISKEIVDAALAFVAEAIKSGARVLIHCNLGESRGPSIGMLYLAARAGSISSVDLLTAEVEFRRIYPSYNPKAGIRGFLAENWKTYTTSLG